MKGLKPYLHSSVAFGVVNKLAKYRLDREAKTKPA